MACVGDQLPLLFPRGLQGLEHQVEALRQLPQIVAAIDADRVQLVGLGDVLDRGRQPPHRRQGRLRHPQSGEGRGQDPDQAGEGNHPPQ